MIRDFSEKAKQKLEGYADDAAASSTWGKIKDWFSDRGMDFQSWTGKLGIENYINDVDTYHQKIIDKNNATKKKIDTIFSNVQSVDTKSMAAMNRQITCGNNIIKLIDDLAASISPDGGNLDMAGMKGTLDADVARIKNPESAKNEKTEKEKLGAGDTSCKKSSDPVNLSTGNFIYDHEDMQAGGEIPLSFHRYYNSKDTGTGTMGSCFLHNYEMEVQKQPDQKAAVRMHDGQFYYFAETDTGYVAENAAMGLLERTEDGYKLTCHPGMDAVYFDENGKAARQENTNKRGITFIRDERGRLAKAETDTGSFLEYAYDSEGMLKEVTDHAGRKVKLEYDGDMLKTVTTPSGAVYTYSYGDNGRITETVNARNVTAVRNRYDSLFRVTHQEFPDGGTMDFEYDDKNSRVTLTERNGSRITYVHDSRYRNTATLYEDGTREKYLYNDRNQCICRTDRNGHTVRMSYDSRGNLTQTVDAGKRRINFTYDIYNNLTSLSINGRTRLKNHYDSKGNLTGTTDALGNRTKIKNDVFGRAEKITYADGSSTELSYDRRGNITAVTDGNGNSTSYEYDLLNRVIKTTDANNNGTHFSYDASDRISTVTDALGNVRKYTYNAGGKVTGLTDFDGKTVSFDYNDLGKISAYTDKEGYRAELAYDRMWNVSSIKSPDGGIQRFIYDSDNRLKEHTLPMGGKIRYAYDAAGNLLSETDAAGNTARYAYDEADRLVRMEAADGAVTTFGYDHEGNLVSETDALGHVTEYTYDDLGRRTGVTDAAGETTSVCYNEIGNVDRICHPNGSSTVYTYEKGGRLRSVLYPDGSGEKYSYDAKGNMTERITMSGERYHYSYDVLDRIVSITNAVGGTQHFEYDALGHVTEAADENGNITRYEYTPNGNLSKVTDALGNETFYQYDAMGHLTQTSCTGTGKEQTQNTAYTWDKEGHVVAVTDQLGDMEIYTYDPAGRMTSKTDRDGYETAISYGADGQVEEIRYADGRTVSLTYNAIRQLEEVKDWLGTTKITMDEAGRVSSVTDPYGKTVGYEWGSMGERTALIYPDGKRAEYEYNNAMQLTAMKLMSNEAPEQTILYSYDEAGRLTGKQMPGGSSTSYAYGNLGRVSEILHTGADFEEHYHYGYDLIGNKISAEKNRQGINADSGRYEYSYDVMNRLTGVSYDGMPQRQYSYDAFGNRRRKTEYTQNGKLITTYGYNTKNQLTTENSENGIRNYSYDHRGNLLSVTSGEEVLKAYGFDAANQMSSSMGMTDGIIQKAVYQYNGLGHRMGQNIATGDAAPARTIRYTLDMTRQYHNLLQKTTDRRTDGNLLHSSQTYFWDGNVAGMEEEGRDHFYFQDDLGSPMRLTDEAGRSEEAYGFDEFGNDIRTAKDIFQDSMQSFGFTGYQMDSAGGLYFAQARRYDAGAGRFVSEDFLKGHIAVPYTMNHYSYCWNRPMDLVDLNGKFPSLRDLKKFWNKYIYGEETIGSSTNTVVTGKNWGIGTYHSEVYDITKTSDKYTGSWIKNVTTLGNDGNSQSYSLNIPSADLGKGNKFGIPTSLGVTFSNGGVSLDANIGIDLGKLNVNIPISIGLNWDNLVSVDASLNGGWADNSYGLDLSAGLHPGSNVKLGVHEKHAVDEKTTIKTENGVYMRMGYVYVVVIAAAALGSMLYGNDPSSAGQTIINFINNFVNNGVCPALQ